ncbi:DUF5107 domain-containing protein [Nonomuraea sp. NPDC050556]|uniref:DUF5107 domain-containing protein n=1 Tax=Nonomuraea sp. NPDC050556 TaxID=3364369 RepID=UPI0037A9146C
MESSLRLDRLLVPAAPLGQDNPLPPLFRDSEINTGLDFGCAVEELAARSCYGQVEQALPYPVQDGYSRDRQPTELAVAVLENEMLKATFLLEYGGRLWSLIHKPTGRELLLRNPVFQPANLATRNAWFSGGVEWNIGVIGHSPLTCSPMHAARVTTPDGVPVLRMYEWERIRQVPFQIDAYLPPGSPVLFVHVRIRNPHRRMTPMYWWSNIAVPETDDLRVLAPADAAWEIGYDRKVTYVTTPISGGVDRSYATRSELAADYFFDTNAARRKWIAALDGQGRGLVQASTGRLRGRKLFFWGSGPGGRRWQEFLSEPGHPYIEIQAGLADTQLEYVPMPPGGSWSWVEAYGLLEADPALVHGTSWNDARMAAEQALEELLPQPDLDASLEWCASWADLPPEEMLHRGSGWGALDRHLRGDADDPATPFPDDTLGAAQQPWLHLLNTGRFPRLDPAEPPVGFMIQEEWLALLDGLPSFVNWAAQLHLGVLRFAAGDRRAARQCWERSVTLQRNAWAIRNLAALDLLEGDLRGACRRYLSAVRLAPQCRPLVVEAATALLAGDRPKDCRRILNALPADLRTHGRIRLLQAQAALALRELDTVASILEQDFDVEDLREGDTSLNRLWLDLHTLRAAKAEGVPADDVLRERIAKEHPVPHHYDFRMASE